MNSMYIRRGKNTLFTLWAFTCVASLSTIWWGDFEGFSQTERIFIPVLVIGIGSLTFLQYIFDKSLTFGLITVPVGAKGLRKAMLCVAIFFMTFPLFIAFGVYD